MLHSSPMRVIQRLFLRCCPSAIRGLIVPVVVDTVNLMQFRWPWPHIRGEVLERYYPTRTDGNIPPTIAMPLLEAWVSTSLLHLSPEAIQRLAPSEDHRIVGATPAQLNGRLFAATYQAGALILLAGLVRCSTTLQSSVMEGAKALRALARPMAGIGRASQADRIWRWVTCQWMAVAFPSKPVAVTEPFCQMGTVALGNGASLHG